MGNTLDCVRRSWRLREVNPSARQTQIHILKLKKNYSSDAYFTKGYESYVRGAFRSWHEGYGDFGGVTTFVTGAGGWLQTLTAGCMFRAMRKQSTVNRTNKILCSHAPVAALFITRVGADGGLRLSSKGLEVRSPRPPPNCTGIKLRNVYFLGNLLQIEATRAGWKVTNVGPAAATTANSGSASLAYVSLDAGNGDQTEQPFPAGAVVANFPGARGRLIALH